LSGEKSEGEEKIDKCSTGQKNPLSERKKLTKEKNNGHMCPRVSRALFSKK
jgi:hypothetical protein